MRRVDGNPHYRPYRLSRLILLAILFTPLSAYAIEIGPANIVQGDCDKLSERTRSSGVIDAGGPHPLRPGNTLATVESVSKSKYAYKPRPDGSVCVDARIKFKLKIESVSTRLDWQPDKKFARVCEKARKDWISKIETHEAGHVKDNNRLEAAYNAGQKTRKYTACGPTPEAAEQEVNGKIQPDIDAAVDEQIKKIKQAEADFHAKYGNAIETPDCCRKEIGFQGVKLILRDHQNTEFVTTITGKVCGDPYKDRWEIRAVITIRPMRGPLRTFNPKLHPWDCLAPGSPEATARENFFKNSAGGGWYCLYEPGANPGEPGKVTIRMPKLDVAQAGRYVQPNNQTVTTTEGPCEEGNTDPRTRPKDG